MNHKAGKLLRPGDCGIELKLPAVGKEVFQMERDAVVSLALADILDEIVLHSGLEAGREGHGGGQLLEHGHFAAGQGEGVDRFTRSTKAANTAATLPAGR